jgi:hypothetical protein
VAGCAPDEAAAEAAFQQAWAVKEAYVKARGDGLGFAPLSRIEVDVAGAPGRPRGAGAGGGGEAPAVRVCVDGAPLGGGWRFELRRLPRRHWAAVALAPPSAIVDAWGVRHGAPVLPGAKRRGGEAAGLFRPRHRGGCRARPVARMPRNRTRPPSLPRPIPPTSPPPQEFTATLLQPGLTAAALEAPPRPPPPFELLTVADLLRGEPAAAYEALFGG